MSEPEKIPGLISPTGGRPTYLNYEPQSEEWAEVWDKITRTLKEAGVDQSEITVYRRGANDSKFSWVAVVSVDAFSIEGIARKYGGGKYQFKTKLNGAFGPSFGIEIDDRILGELDKIQQQQPTVMMAPGPTVDPIEMFKTVKSMMGDDNKTQDMMMRFQERQEASRAQTTQMIVGLAGALAPVFVALFQRPADKESKLMELMLPMLINKPQMDATATLHMIKELRSMVDPGEKDDGLIEKIGKLVMAAAPALMGAMAQAPQIPMKQITEGPAPAAPAGNPPPDINAIVTQVHLGLLIKAAQQNGDPASFAGVIETLADDQQWAALIGLLMRPDWLAVLTTQVPPLAPHGEWLTRLRDELIPPNEDAAPEPAKDAATTNGKPKAEGKIIK